MSCPRSYARTFAFFEIVAYGNYTVVIFKNNFLFNQGMDSSNSPSTKPLYRGTQIVWYLLGVVEVLLAFRFVLRIFGANPEAGFTSFIYGTTYIFAAPFLSVFSVSKVVAGSYFEWTTLLSMLVYWLVAFGIVKLFLIGKTVSTPEAAAKLDEEENK